MLILGDMRELGKDSAEEHQRIVDYLEEYGFEDVILVGELFAATRHTYTTYPDAPALIAALQKNKPCGKTILIKGSNGIKTEYGSRLSLICRFTHHSWFQYETSHQ